MKRLAREKTALPNVYSLFSSKVTHVLDCELFADRLSHRVNVGFPLNGVDSCLFETARGGEGIERGAIRGGQCTRGAPGEIVYERL